MLTGQYRCEEPSEALDTSLAAMNALGARGYAFVSVLAQADGSGDFYLSDSAHQGVRLEYALAPQAASSEAELARCNQQGASGWAFKGPVGYGGAVYTLFVRETGGKQRFVYEKMPLPTALSQAGFQAQLNAQGARGFRLVGPMSVGGEIFNLYVKDASTTTYSYSLQDITDMHLPQVLLKRLETMGAQGYLYLGGMVLAGSTGAQVYEKSSAQSGRVDYHLQELPDQTSLAQFLDGLNERAAQGYFFYGELVLGGQRVHKLSVRGAVALRHPLAGITFP